MNNDGGEIHWVNEVTTTDGIIAKRAWQIFLNEVDFNVKGFSESEKNEIRNYIFNRTGLDSRPTLKNLAEDCILKASSISERERQRGR